jgi:RNA polymerase sigma-70 factor (ECF subfamily)
MNERSREEFVTGPDEDRDLVEQIRSDRPELFHELVSRHEVAIFRGAMAILRNAADAEDVTQETFLRAFRHLDQFRGDAKFRTWLLQIAVNVARSRLKSVQREQCESLEVVDASGNAAHGWPDSCDAKTPEDEYSWKELSGFVRRILDGMHPIYRSVLYLRDVENLSTGTTAVALGLTPENVRTRLRRARAHLRARMQQYWQS